MPAELTRIWVQLQQGRTHLESVKNEGIALTWLQIAMAVRTLHANTCDLFPKKQDQLNYQRAVDKLCETLRRANETGFLVETAGNKFREEFWGTRGGKAAEYRIDIEIVAGQPSRA